MALGPEAPAADGRGWEPVAQGRRKNSGGGKGRQSDQHQSSGKGRKADAPESPPVNDRFAALAPSRDEPSSGSRGSKGGKGGGSVADRMRKSTGSESGSVAERMKKSPVSDASPGSDDKDDHSHRNRDEVWTEIHEVVQKQSCLQQSDFDYRIRQHLHAILGNGGRPKLHEALVFIQTACQKKTRADVRNWPAYLVKLLKKFDEDVAWKDREERAKARVVKAAGEESASTSTVSPDRDPQRELNEEEAWLEALSSNQDKLFDFGESDDSPSKETLSPERLFTEAQAPGKGYSGRVEDASLEGQRLPPSMAPPPAPQQAPPSMPPAPQRPPMPQMALHQPPTQPPSQVPGRHAAPAVGLQQPPTHPPSQVPGRQAAAAAAAAAAGARAAGPMQTQPSTQPGLRPTLRPPGHAPMGAPVGPAEAHLNGAHHAQGVGRLQQPPQAVPLQMSDREMELQAQKLHQQLLQQHQAFPGQGPGQYPARTADPLVAPRQAQSGTALNFSMEAWAAFALSPAAQNQ